MKHKSKLSNKELASFTSQISILLKAGITPLEGIRILIKDTKDREGKKLLNDLSGYIASGSTFTEAVARTEVFPDYLINTLRLGEEAGSLDEVTDSLSLYYDREDEIQESIKSALTYPIIMLVLMALIIVVLITRVLPIFETVFTALGKELTGFAEDLLVIGNTLRSYSLIFIGLIIAILFLYIFLSKTAWGKKILSSLSKHILFTKGLNLDIAASRFASGMALAISQGLDTYASLNLVKELVNHKKIASKIDICREAILNGDSLAGGIKAAGIFSNIDNRMIEVGVKSGSIDKVLWRIADEYEKKYEKKLNNLVSVIEPTLVIILSLIVGLILLSVILPLMGIMAELY